MYPAHGIDFQPEERATVDSDNMGNADTHFAPAERADIRKLQAARDDFVYSPVATRLLDAVPDPAMVLYETRQIVIANSVLLRLMGLSNSDELMGMRPGEMLECVHSCEMPGGCGTSRSCRYCGAGQAIVECLHKGRITAQECRIRTRNEKDGGALDVFVQVTPIVARNRGFAVLHMRDISAERRRKVLERVFFHDLSNAAFGLRSVADALRNRAPESQDDKELRETLYRAAVQISDELHSHRALLRAESGELVPDFTPVPVDAQVELVRSVYSGSEIAGGRNIVVGEVPDVEIITDPMLLQRVLSNLVRNAVEATQPGGTVTISARDESEKVVFVVGNPGAMPEDVQHQIFQRSFSTKDGAGRGIGTYSVKLLTERYLGGEVSFTSREPEGTLFFVALPKVSPGP